MMSTQRLPGWLAPIALLIPLSASALPVTWNFSGVLTTNTVSDPGELPQSIVPGAAYNLTLSFDTDDFIIPEADSPSSSSWYVNKVDTPDRGISFSLSLDCDDGESGIQPCNATPSWTSSSGIVMSSHILVDGNYLDIMQLTLFRAEDNDYHRWRLNLVGGDDVFPNFGQLPIPTVLSPQFVSHSLEMCNTDATSLPPALSNIPCNSDWKVFGSSRLPGHELPETPVPAPATLALLGMGIAGLGLARRRRRVTT